MPNQTFDWTNDNPDVVAPDARATAVYLNAEGEIVIRQQKAWDEEDDPFLALPPEYAIRVARKILRLAGDSLRVVADDAKTDQ